MGGMWGGLAGAFFATRIGAIDPTSFTFQLSVLILIVIVLGGTGSLPGVLVGALVVVALPELLRELSDVRLLVFAVLLVGMMLLRPQGLWPRIRRKPKPFYGLQEEEPEDVAARILREHQVQMEERDRRHAAAGHKVPAAGEILLEVDGLVQQFGGLRAVDNVSFSVRRVEIARALAAHPHLVLFDEPAAGMNPTEKLELVGIIRKIRDLGITVVLIEHDMSLVMRVSGRIAVLDHGILIALGKPAEIQNDPAVIEAYLGREDDDMGRLTAQEA